MKDQTRPEMVPGTAALLERLFKTASFDHFLQQNEQAMQPEPFHLYICAMCRQKGLVREHVIQRANIERGYGHQIFRGIREPSRDKVLQLAFGFGLSVPEAQRLLRAAEKSPLYPRLKRDAAILFCINRGESLVQMQLLLSELGLSPLGGAEC